VKKCILLWCVVVVLALHAGTVTCTRDAPIDARGWTLSQFVEHVQASGLELTVVPTYRGGRWGNRLFLCENPNTAWVTCQARCRSKERLLDWLGVILIECAGPDCPDEPDGEQEYFAQIDSFHIFGDPRLVEGIRKAFRRCDSTALGRGTPATGKAVDSIGSGR
jgi:hypothetical protein